MASNIQTRDNFTGQKKNLTQIKQYQYITKKIKLLRKLNNIILLSVVVAGYRIWSVFVVEVVRSGLTVMAGSDG